MTIFEWLPGGFFLLAVAAGLPDQVITLDHGHVRHAPDRRRSGRYHRPRYVEPRGIGW